jgi:hypothetical protein
VSGTVYDQTEGKLALAYVYLAGPADKNIVKPLRVCRVAWSLRPRIRPQFYHKLSFITYLC